MNALKRESLLERLFQKSKKFRFKKGEIVLRPDDLSTDIYYIEKGFIRVYTLTQWGDEKLLVIYKPGELFPLFWLFNSLPLVRFYEAADEAVLRKMKKDDFLHVLGTQPDIALELIHEMIDLFDVLMNRIDSLEYTNAYARLISRLLYLARRFGSPRGTHVLIDVPLRHRDIASSLAMTRETASREFEKLERKGIIRYVNKLIVITDLELLEKELSSHFDKSI